MKNQGSLGGNNIAAGSATDQLISGVAVGGSQAYSNLIASLLSGSTNSSNSGVPHRSNPHAGNKDLQASTKTAAAAITSTSQPRKSLPGNGSRMLAPTPANGSRATYNQQQNGGTSGAPSSSATSVVTSNTSAAAASITNQGVVQQLLASLQHPQQTRHFYGDQSRTGTTTAASSALADLLGRSTAGGLGSDATSSQLQPQHSYKQGNMGTAATNNSLNDVLMLLQPNSSGSSIGGLDPATAALLSILGGGAGASLAAGTGGMKHSAAASVESRTMTSSSLDNTTQPMSNVTTSQRGEGVQQSSQPAKGTASLGNTTFTTADDTIATTDAKKDASSTKLSDRAASASLLAPGGAPSIAQSANSGKLSKNILPCRARGMPLDHNFSNAYFIVTQDTKHGDHLVCSYPKCRNGGVKFRYCSVCRIPVAQRIFYRRHSHQEIIVSKNASATPNPIKSAKKNSSSSSSGAKNPAALGTENMRKTEGLHQDIIKKALKQSGILPVSRGATPLESQVAAVPTAKSKSRKGQLPENAEKTPPKSKGGKGHRRKRSSSQDPEDPVALLALNMSKLPPYRKEELVDPVRRRAWTLLLLNRPDPSDDLGMSAWLMHVMSVSDSSNKVNLEKLERIYGAKPTEAPALLAATAAEQMVFDRWRQKDATKDRSRSSNSRKKKKTKILHKPPKEDAADSSLSDSAGAYAEASKELDQGVPSLEADGEIQADHQETQVEDSRDATNNDTETGDRTDKVSLSHNMSCEHPSPLTTDEGTTTERKKEEEEVGGPLLKNEGPLSKHVQ